MSRDNVDLVYRLVDAFNRRDIDSFLALCDPDIEYFSHLVELEGGTPYCGHDGIRSRWESLLAEWRHGKEVWGGVFLSEAEALKAAGLSE